MATLQLIDQTTVYPDGKIGDDAFDAFAKVNSNFQALQAAADMSSVSVTNDQALYWNGTTWTPYVVSAAARAMLAATDAAGIRASIKAVGTEGNETIAGNKTLSGATVFTGSITQRTGTIGGVEIQSPGGNPGIVGRNGDPADVNNQYRHDIQFGAGHVLMRVGTAKGSTAGAGGWRMDNHFYPLQANQMDLGTDAFPWKRTFVNEIVMKGDATAKAATLTSLGAASTAALSTVDTKATNAQTTADGKASKTGDTFTGPTRVNASFKVQTVANQNMLRFFNSGAGTTALQSVTSDEASFAPMELRGTSVNITGTNVFLAGTTVRLDATQLLVAGPAIPAGQYAGYIIQEFQGKPGSNADKYALQYYRSNGSTGTSWSDFTWRMGRTVDATTQQFMEYQPTGDIYFQCGTGAGGNVRFSATGVLTASGGVSGGGSDPRIKDSETLRPIENATDALLALNTRIGRYLEGFGDGGIADRAFVMADDAMRQNTPEVILENAIDGQYAAWATDQLIAYLVAAHREGVQREAALRATIETLSARLDALEGGA